MPTLRKKSQIKNLILHPKLLKEKEEEIKPKAKRTKEIIKIRKEIKETENRKNNGELK